MYPSWPVVLGVSLCWLSPAGAEPPIFERIAAESRGESAVFLLRNEQVQVWFRTNDMILSEPGSRPVRLRWHGASSSARLFGIEHAVAPPEIVPARGVPRHAYRRIRVAGLYSGIDLDYYFLNGHFEWDLRVAAGADPTVARFEIEGGSAPVLTSNGSLRLRAGAAAIGFGRPFAYQREWRGRSSVSTEYELSASGTIRFAIGRYDRSRPLIIDPEVIFSETLGGRGDETIRAVAVDRDGNAYVAGETNSPDFPALDPSGVPAQPRRSEQTHMFVAKIPAAGGRPVYSTYIAASGSESPYGIAVDALGDAYVTGETSSPDFPVTRNSPQKKKGGGWDAFVLKLDPTGRKIVYATYLGGEGDDRARAIAVDASGRAFVTGYSNSPDFPTTNGALRRKIASFDAFVVRLTPGGALSYATLLGGRFDEYAFGIATDRWGAAYVIGQTNSPDFPATPGAFRTAKTGFWDAFVAKIDIDHKRLDYSTFLGGTRDANSRGTTYGTAIAVAGDGAAYVTGYTDAINLPTTRGAAKTRASGGLDAFVGMLDPKGATALYMTYLGGRGSDRAHAVAVDGEGYAYVAGQTQSPDFPGRDAKPLPSAFFVRLDPGGTRIAELAQSGMTYENAYAIAIGTAASVWSAGRSRSAPGRGTEGFILKLSAR
jgi:hypothetical protein